MRLIPGASDIFPFSGRNFMLPGVRSPDGQQVQFTMTEFC